MHTAMIVRQKEIYIYHSELKRRGYGFGNVIHRKMKKSKHLVNKCLLVHSLATGHRGLRSIRPCKVPPGLPYLSPGIIWLSMAVALFLAQVFYLNSF